MSFASHVLTFSITSFLLVASLAADQDGYLPGGPLAGLKLPLFPGQHGEAPGYPGCIPELMGTEEKTTARAFAPQDQSPQVELYPGSQEHWRSYWFKYVPARSFFDRQSQVRNFVAPGLPGAKPAQIESYAAPVYWVPRQSEIRDSGKKRAPVSVVRMAVGDPVLTLDLGPLDVGLYALRVIAAVPTTELRPFRKPVYMRCAINDGPSGAVTEYKLRLGYCDEFYGVAAFYFHVDQARQFKAELAVDNASEVDLLVHNISLDDCLVGTVRRAVKQRGAGMPAVVKPATLDASTRRARDEAIWNFLPPPNHQGSGQRFKQAAYYAIMPAEVDLGVAGKSRKDLHAEIGVWDSPDLIANGRFTSDATQWPLFLRRLTPPGQQADAAYVSGSSGSYSLADMKAYRPLPDPFPYQDNGTGLYFADARSPDRGHFLAEQGMEVTKRFAAYPALIQKGAELWQSNGDSDIAHDAAVALARYAYVFPTVETGSWLCNLVRDPGAYGRNLHDRRRETEAMFMAHYADYLKPAIHYDMLYDYIRGNEELARSIGRFVPWVKTSSDVIMLIDTYLVQINAKRIMRYHYYTEPMGVATLAWVLGSAEVTAPWWDWLFSRTFIYPLPPAGIQDLMILGHDRSGAQFIGSTFYAQQEGAQRVASALEWVRAHKILPDKYDLSNAALYPKPLAHCYWQLDITVAGLDFPRIGDVCGPDKAPGMTMGMLPWAAVNGWNWTGDRQFAWCLKHANDKDIRKYYSDAQWSEIEAAAADLKRAPWLDLKSRQVYNWMGVLEAGTEHDDPLLRRAAYLRTGLGIGHDHDDALDLQYYMLGVPMTIDGGQRPGYTVPGDGLARVHNLVEVDAGNHRAQAWVSTLSDGVGAAYLRATAVLPAENVRLYQRSIALIDADTQPQTSYVFDVFRVAGGKSHVYCFHGPISDEVLTNASLQPVPQIGQSEPTADQLFLKPFADAQPHQGATVKTRMISSRRAGNAPPVLETTWRYSRDGGPGSEQMMLNTRQLGNQFNEQAPRRYTKLHLMDTQQMRVFHADALCFQLNYRYVQQMVRRESDGADLESAFTALHEPYIGTPFIASRRMLTIVDNEDDARRAVALEVKHKSGRVDLLVSDGRPEKSRAITSESMGRVAVAGEHAFVAQDAQGIRILSLTGGTLLKVGQFEIHASTREYTGTITAVDYLTRQLKLDAPLPGAAAGSIVEIGNADRTTSYTLAAAVPSGKNATLTLMEGADYYRSEITQVDEQTGFVQGTIKHALGRRPGLDKGFTASNDARTRFWRAEMASSRNFVLTGAPVKASDFAPENVIRLWEYGAGDAIRQSTFVHLRRLGNDQHASAAARWELTCNVEATVIIPGAAARKVTAAELDRANGPIRIQIP